MGWVGERLRYRRVGRAGAPSWYPELWTMAIMGALGMCVCVCCVCVCVSGYEDMAGQVWLGKPHLIVGVDAAEACLAVACGRGG